MSTVAFQVDIEAPIEHVWACLDDETRLPLWIPEIVETTFLDARPPGGDLSGARFRQTARIGRRAREYDGEVTLYHPPWLFGLRVGDSNVKVMLTFDIYPIGTGTRVDYCVDVIAVSWTAMLLDAVVRPLLARLMARHLANLKRVVEDMYAEDALAPPAHMYFPDEDEDEPEAAESDPVEPEAVEPEAAAPDAADTGDEGAAGEPAPAKGPGQGQGPVPVPVAPPIAAE